MSTPPNTAPGLLALRDHTGPEFLRALARAATGRGQHIAAMIYSNRAAAWAADLANRDRCHGCRPGLVADVAAARAAQQHLRACIAGVIDVLERDGDEAGQAIVLRALLAEGAPA